ncbi:MAG: hypothetical protein KGL37_09320 [Acidobacteriota bacterium]|nr:hypothetical protein [Acidobacteriota bacterium]
MRLFRAAALSTPATKTALVTPVSKKLLSGEPCPVGRVAFAPALPGYGDAGGMEILTGQRQFLVDLYGAVKKQVEEGKTLAQINVQLPVADRNWSPKHFSWDVEAAYNEITQHKPAGALPHVRK